jgi:hypothetical protein
MILALMLAAFTMGAVLEPLMAKTARRLAHTRHSRKVGKAITLLESEGYILKWPPKDGSKLGTVTSLTPEQLHEWEWV